MLQKFRDPVSGLTHLSGAFLGCAGLVFLLVKSIGRAPASHVAAFSLFSISLVLLYSSSALYHLLNISDSSRVVFRRIDHTMIFVLIAGSYTPFCVIALPGLLGRGILIAVWGLALVGLFLSTFWLHAPRWLSTSLYLFMGWIIIGAIYPLAQTLSTGGLLWLIGGGVFYTVGAIIYWLKKPDPFPPVFGFHEIWHLFVLGGSFCHFISVATLLP